MSASLEVTTEAASTTDPQGQEEQRCSRVWQGRPMKRAAGGGRRLTPSLDAQGLTSEPPAESYLLQEGLVSCARILHGRDLPPPKFQHGGSDPK